MKTAAAPGPPPRELVGPAAAAGDITLGAGKASILGPGVLTQEQQPRLNGGRGSHPGCQGSQSPGQVRAGPLLLRHTALGADSCSESKANGLPGNSRRAHWAGVSCGGHFVAGPLPQLCETAAVRAYLHGPFCPGAWTPAANTVYYWGFTSLTSNQETGRRGKGTGQT